MTKGQDLSVEEILNSIRGVINNHSTKMSKKESNDDILELTEINHGDNSMDYNQELVSESVMEEATEALRGFADNASKLSPEMFKGNADKTIEGLVVEILRPEIKKWLNTNLPSLVRQLVEREIRRLAPKE